MIDSHINAIRLCKVSAIAEGCAMAFSINDQAVFAVKKSGQIYVYRNRCPHLGSELEWQDNAFLNNDGSLIRCHTHGALFEIESGLCISGPCSGASLTPLDSDIRDDALYVLNLPPAP